MGGSGKVRTEMPSSTTASGRTTPEDASVLSATSAASYVSMDAVAMRGVHNTDLLVSGSASYLRSPAPAPQTPSRRRLTAESPALMHRASFENMVLGRSPAIGYKSSPCLLEEEGEDDEPEEHLSASRQRLPKVLRVLRYLDVRMWIRRCAVTSRKIRHWWNRTSKNVPASKRFERLKRRNVRAALSLTAFTTLMGVLMQGAVLDAYLFLTSNSSNSMVGIAESLNGLTILTLLAPVAFAVDKFDRAHICKIAAFLGVVGGFLSFFAFYLGNLTLVLASLIVWGANMEFSTASTDCIFVDSINRSKRTDLLCRKSMIEASCAALAQLLQLIYFFVYGDLWSLTECRILLIGGTLLCVPPAVSLLMLFVDPRRSPAALDCLKEIDAETDGEKGGLVRSVTAATASGSTPSTPYVALDEDNNAGLSSGGAAAASLSPSALSQVATEAAAVETDLRESGGSGSQRQTDDDKEEEAFLETLTKPQRMIPFLVAASDFTRSMGAGMTVRFFNLFFINEYDLTPTQLGLLNLGVLVFLAYFTDVARLASKKIGRAPCAVVFQLLSLFCLFLIVEVRTLWIVVISFLLRGALQNGVWAVNRAVIADTTRSRNRGKWMAIESVSSATWCGSAFIGGIIADKYSYRFAFHITNLVYALAACMYLPVAFLLPNDEKLYARAAFARAAAILKANADSSTVNGSELVVRKDSEAGTITARGISEQKAEKKNLNESLL